MDLGFIFDVVTALIGVYIICKYLMGVNKQDYKFKKLYINETPDLNVVYYLVIYIAAAVVCVTILMASSSLKKMPDVIYLSYDEPVTMIISAVISTAAIVISFLISNRIFKKEYKGTNRDRLKAVIINGIIAGIPLNYALQYYLDSAKDRFSVGYIFISLYIFVISSCMTFVLVGRLMKVEAKSVRLHFSPDFLVTINTGGREKEIKDKLECGLLDERDGYLFVDKDGMVLRISTGSVIMIEPLK